MAVQTTEEFKNGGATSYAITIEYLKASDIKVRIDGALQTYVASSPGSGEYTVSGTTVTLGAAAASGTGNVHIYRETDVDTAAAVFVAGSSIKAADLNAVHDMGRFAAVEHRNTIITSDIKDDAVTSAKIADLGIARTNIANDAIDGTKIADDSIDSEHYVDSSIDTQHIANANITTAKLDNNAVTTAKIADGNVTTAKIADANVTTAKLADGSVTDVKLAGGALDARYYTKTLLDGGQLDNRYFTETELTNGALDGRYFTETEADARYFNISTGDTIKDGDTFPDNDTTIATTAAINDRIIDLVDDVGGFVPIANETSFPTANPDVNNGSGTLVSIQSISSTRTPSSGTVTITNGAGSGNDVTITGCGSTVLTSGFGVIVETTSTLHTYAFHRLVPKATEVTTVAGISGNVTTVAGISANTTTVAGISSDVTTVAGIASNVTSVANNSSNINSAVSNASNINSAVSNASNINTVAGSIANVNTTAGSIASVNSAASNISSIANFGDQYQVAANNPTTDGGGNALAAGDLYFNTSANELKVYNGSSWQGGVTASGNFASTTGNTFTGTNKHNDNVKFVFGTGDDLEIFHNTDSIINDSGDGTLKLQTGGNTKLEIQSAGVGITGNITVSGTVDGRDVAADGTKLDGIATSSTANPNAIDNLVEDTTPQLGGDLDMNGNSISSGTLNVKNSGSQSEVRLFCEVSNAHYAAIKAPAHANFSGNLTYTLPSSITNGQYIKTDANGNLSFASPTENDFTTTLKNKLDGIESGATADQTDAEIRAAVEAATDSNVFTDADHTKLNGIEASATADQTASEIVALVADQTIAPSEIDMDDNEKIKLGTGDDLEIYHSSNGNNYIKADSGELTIYTASDADLYIKTNNENAIKCDSNGAVELYYDNSKKLETVTGGVSVTGDMTASGNVTAYSDAKLKTEIHTINDALGIVGKLRGVNYKWLRNGQSDIGVIAQEVEEVIPEVVKETEDGTKTVDYSRIVSVLINAVNELKAEVDELKGGK